VYKVARDPAASAAATAKHMSHSHPEPNDMLPRPAPLAPAPPPKPPVAASGAPPPLKPAPWAGVTPGSQVSAAKIPSSATGPPVSPGAQVNPSQPPPPPPRQKQDFVEEVLYSADNIVDNDASAQESVSPVLMSAGRFDLFGSNPLVAALGNGPVAQEESINSAFTNLSIGPQVGNEQSVPPPGFFGDRGSFLDMQTANGAMHNPLSYQGAAMGGIDAPVFQPASSIGLSMVPPGMGFAPVPTGGMMSPQAPSFSMGMTAGDLEQSDEWGDLQLQLPSDLGEILGTDMYREAQGDSQSQGHSWGL